MNTSTSSMGSFSSEEDDLSDDSDDSSDLFSSSSPESPVDSPIMTVDSPMMSSNQIPQTPTFITTPQQQHQQHQQQQFLHELQLQQQIQQALMMNNTYVDNSNNFGWDWSVPQQQQINVHTAGASMPIAMPSVPMAIANGMFTNDAKFMPHELMELYHSQALQNQQIQELQYALVDASQVQNLSNNINVEEFSPVSVEGNYGLNFLNLEMPGYCPLPLDM